MDRRKGILLISLVAAFLAALICIAAAFFPNRKAENGGYFVEFSLSDDFYVDGEPLSDRERGSLETAIGALLREIEDEIGTDKSDSDIARINAAAAGESVAVGEHTRAMLALCKQLYAETDGAFTPSLFALSELWGFSPSHEGHYTDPRPEPDSEEIAAALAASCFDGIVLQGNTVIKADGETKLDLGGIAKGYMSDAAAELVRQRYEGKQIDGILTVMSNTVLFGQKHDENAAGGLRGYTMQIDNPRSLVTGTGRAAVATGLSDVAVSTSADTYRFYVWDGKIYKHILDPHTGRPSENGVISISVFVPLNMAGGEPSCAGAYADALSTAGFCMPLREALAFYGRMADQYGVGSVIITADFRYYVIGDHTVLDPGDFAEGDKNVFARTDAEEPPETVEPCAKEREYIEYVAERTGA